MGNQQFLKRKWTDTLQHTKRRKITYYRKIQQNTEKQFELQVIYSKQCNNILQDIVHNYNNTYPNIIKITLSEIQKKEKCKCIISYF